MSQSSATTSTVVTFLVEGLLYSGLLTGTSMVMAHYLEFLQIPAAVFMFVDTVSVLASINTAIIILLFSTKFTKQGGSFTNSLIAEASQGFSVVSTIMWVALLMCLILELPRISSIPGKDASSSVIPIAIVLGLGTVIPLLSFVVTFAATPDGATNSLFFNGSTVGAVSLLFMVVASLGNGGVMKCYPYAGGGTSFIFWVLVVSYWTALYVLEVIVYCRWNPFGSMWAMLTGGDRDLGKKMPTQPDEPAVGFAAFWRVIKQFHINYWRILGGVLNVVIVITTLNFTNSNIHSFVGLMVVIIAAVHIPLVFSFKDVEKDIIPAALSGLELPIDRSKLKQGESYFPQYQNRAASNTTKHEAVFDSRIPAMQSAGIDLMHFKAPASAVHQGPSSLNASFARQRHTNTNIEVFS